LVDFRAFLRRKAEERAERNAFYESLNRQAKERYREAYAREFLKAKERKAIQDARLRASKRKGGIMGAFSKMAKNYRGVGTNISGFGPADLLGRRRKGERKRLFE
jgi:CRISPR/Cas system endoribonuclease Cas6 (RAMP superfamily)